MINTASMEDRTRKTYADCLDCTGNEVKFMLEVLSALEKLLMNIIMKLR